MYLLTDLLPVVISLVLNSRWLQTIRTDCQISAVLCVKLGSKNNRDVSEMYQKKLAPRCWQKLLECLHDSLISFADSDNEAVICNVVWWPRSFAERLHSSTYPRCCELYYCVSSLLFWLISLLVVSTICSMLIEFVVRLQLQSRDVFENNMFRCHGWTSLSPGQVPYMLQHITICAMEMSWQLIKNTLRIENKSSSMPHCQLVRLCQSHSGWMAVSWWLSLCQTSAFGLTVTLTFDAWPWKPFQRCPLTCWIFVPSFIEILLLGTEILLHTK